MPPMIATPLAVPSSTEQESDQEFELDIRISTSKTPQPSLNVTNYGTGCCTEISCGACTETYCTYCTCNRGIC